ncbi:MAG: hypothetical protein AAGK32_21185, partial [Actinomycetota bacterium]
DFDEGPSIQIEIVIRIQRLATEPDVVAVLSALPEQSPSIGELPLDRSAPTLEVRYNRELDDRDFAVEVSYEGLYLLDEDSLADGSAIDGDFAAMGGWIAATLVKLGDLELDYRPPDGESP